MTRTRPSRANKRDANEGPIVEAWRACHCALIEMQPGQGCDWIVVAPNGVHIVEIKRPGKWTLTPDELRTKCETEAAGGKYNIVETVADALRMVGR